jgi:hypothetical protein
MYPEYINKMKTMRRPPKVVDVTPEGEGGRQ